VYSTSGANVTVAITNKISSTIHFSLYHKFYCENGGPCKCKNTIHTHVVPGRISKGVVIPGRTYTENKILAATLTVLPGKTVHDIHEAVLNLPHVKSAEKFKAIRMEKEVEKKKPGRRKKSEPELVLGNFNSGGTESDHGV